MYYNYLDIVSSDIIEKILNNNMLDIEKQLELLEQKIVNLELKLKPLNITKYNKFIQITYDNIFYNVKDYLFCNINERIVLLNVYNDLFADYYGTSFISEVLYNPTYLDILIEVNKSVIKTNDYYHKYLDGLYELKPSILYNYTGIVAEENIKYYEILLGG